MKWPRLTLPRFTWIRAHWMQLALLLAAVAALLSLALNLVLMNRIEDGADRAAVAEARAAAAESAVTELEDRLAGVESATGLIVSQALELQQILADLAPQVDSALEQAAAQVAAFAESTITFNVDINEEVPINLSFPFRRTIEFPINTSIPIDETIRTTIKIDGPFGIDIPVGVTVPVSVEVPIDLTIPFTIDEQVDIATSITVDLEFPLSIAVAETGLADFARQLEAGLESIREVVAGLA